MLNNPFCKQKPAILRFADFLSETPGGSQNSGPLLAK